VTGAGSYLHIAVYVVTTGGNRAGWTVSTVRGSQVAYLGFIVQARAGGMGELRKHFPNAVQLFMLTVTSDQYSALEDERLN
jgi:hypothetical protein